MEILADLGCTSYNDGAHWKIQNSNYFCDKKSDIIGISIHGDEHANTLYDRDTSGWSYDFDHLNTGTIVDSRDGETYKTIGIKSQVWMAENLRYKSATSKCHYEESSEDETYCIEHGRLYKWSDARQACPEGWHLPDTTDWKILWKATGKTHSYLVKDDPNVSEFNNAYGFSSIPSNYGDRNDYFSYTYAADGQTIIDSTLETNTAYRKEGYYFGTLEILYYWTSTLGETTIGSDFSGTITWPIPTAYAANLANSSVLIQTIDRDYTLLSVRCVKDSEE